jgi:hypothetical protein
MALLTQMQRKEAAAAPKKKKGLLKKLKNFLKGGSKVKKSKDWKQLEHPAVLNKDAKQFSRISGLGRMPAKAQSSGCDEDELVLPAPTPVTRFESSPALKADRRVSQSDGTPFGTPKRAASSPQLALMSIKNLSKQASHPLTLSEKLSRWCRQSPEALFKGCPPEDDFFNFPAVDYSDLEVDRRAEHQLLSNINGTATTDEFGDAHIDEVMVERYPAGRHGLTPRTRPTGAPGACEVAFKAQKEHLRAKRSQHKLMIASKKGSSTNLVQTDKALQWKQRQQKKDFRSGTQVSMAAGVGSARDLSACLGSQFDLNQIRDAAMLACVSE